MPADLEQVSLALVNKGKALGQLGRAEEARGRDGTMRDAAFRGRQREPPITLAVASALVSKGELLSNLDRHSKALATWNEVVHRFGNSTAPELQTLVANALVGKSVALNTLNRPREALEASDEALERFGKSGSPGLSCVEVAVAWSHVVKLLMALRLHRRGHQRLDRGGGPFRKERCPLEIAEQVAFAQANIGTALLQTGQMEESLFAYSTTLCKATRQAMHRSCVEVVSYCFVNKRQCAGRTLNRETEALSSWEEAIRGFEAWMVYAEDSRTALQRADE